MSDELWNESDSFKTIQDNLKPYVKFKLFGHGATHKSLLVSAGAQSFVLAAHTPVPVVTAETSTGRVMVNDRIILIATRDMAALKKITDNVNLLIAKFYGGC